MLYGFHQHPAGQFVNYIVSALQHGLNLSYLYDHDNVKKLIRALPRGIRYSSRPISRNFYTSPTFRKHSCASRWHCTISSLSRMSRIKRISRISVEYTLHSTRVSANTVCLQRPDVMSINTSDTVHQLTIAHMCTKTTNKGILWHQSTPGTWHQSLDS